MATVRFDLTRDEVTRYNAACDAVDYNEVEHFRTRVHLHFSRRDLAVAGTIGAEQQMLPRPTACIKSSCHLGASEGPVVEESDTFAGHGHTLRYTMIHIVYADFITAEHVFF